LPPSIDRLPLRQRDHFRFPMRLDSVTAGTRANAARGRERSMQPHRRHILRVAAAAVAVALPAVLREARAETYPSRPITIIVPFAPGALNDIVARLLSDGMARALGQPVIVENVTGADGTIATNRVARGTPDGYTFVIGSWNTHVANGLIYSLQYDVVKDFEPVMLLPAAPMVLIAKKPTPATDLKGFIAWLKANPDKASVGTAGVGSPPHMLALLFRNRTETRFGFIPYRGAGPAMQDVIAGQIDATFITVAPALPQVAAGSIKAFGLTAAKRVAAAPDLPTMDEAGLPDFYFSYWSGLFAPRGTPKDIVSAVGTAAVAAMRDPQTRQKLDGQAFETPPPERQTPQALADLQRAEIAKWWPIIKDAGIKAD
jgi:tripartite-type tricarboxylate transporter receptor subunit TctC